MSEQKKHPNPFIRMAQEAKAKQGTEQEFPHADKPAMKQPVPKPTKGFGNKIIKKTGRA